MPIARRRKTATAIAVVFGAVAILLIGMTIVRFAWRQIGEDIERSERIRWQQWLAEQKQSLLSGDASGVHFYSTRGTDELLAQLAGLPEIEGLYFELTDLTDEGVATLAELPNLRSLTLYGGNPRVGDVGLATLSRSRSLEKLRLVNTDVTDDGLAALQRFPRLRDLTIACDVGRLTEKAVHSLSALEQLDKLKISGHWMSKAGLAELKRALPNCDVVEKTNWRDP